MRKNIVPILAVLTLVSCGGGESNSVKQQGFISQPVEEGQEESTVPQSENHYAIWQMDSLNEVNFKTSHLIAMELCGHVKRVVDNSITAEFDNNGVMTRYDDGQGELQIMGEPNDEVLSLYVPGGASSYRIDLKNKRLVSYSGGEYAYNWENKYLYDEKGNLVSIEENVTEEEKTSVNKVAVTILETDHHGNWIKRKYGNRIATRTILYYDNAIGGAEESFDPMTSAIELKGSIGGDANCSFSLCGGKGEYKNRYGGRLTKAVSYSSGKLKVEAYDKKTNALLGTFDGDFSSDPSRISYKGVFTNTKTGGKVNFDLHN
ncbi:MAG: hypothetical protein MJZ33_06850 [Paludibacteraceae bacterium]|nr:hypothetical protein [Paludibacteraceae bacterium]